MTDNTKAAEKTRAGRRAGEVRRSTVKSVQRMFFRSQMILIITLALFLGAAGTLINIHFENEKRDENLQNVAQAVAHSPILTDISSDSAEKSVILSEYLDSLVETLDDIDVVSVVGKDGVRLYHSNHSLIGTVYDGTVPSFENGTEYYAADETGPSGTQRRACAAVLDESGGYAGFVMAIMLMENVYGETYQTLIIFALITAAAVLAELLVSAEFFRKIKKSLLGYEPDVFSAMYKIRDNILESLDEGVIAVDEKGFVQFANKAASAMLGGGEGGDKLTVGKKTGAPGAVAVLERTLESGEKYTNYSLGGADILIDSIPVKEDGAVVGAVGILRDRAEYTKLMEDLAGTRYLVDSMRANNHDFTNKLHVILGLIEMKEYEEAASYIQNISMVQRSAVSRIMNAVGDPAVAALLIGKTARASELNVKFILREGCRYSPSDIKLPSDVLVTVIGNLLDNAFEAMNQSRGVDGERELLFGIFSRPGAALITVDDTGKGISGEDIGHIFENGYSTKGGGRGTGLYQVKKLAEEYGGTVTVQSQEGAGASFTVSFCEVKQDGDNENV